MLKMVSFPPFYNWGNGFCQYPSNTISPWRFSQTRSVFDLWTDQMKLICCYCVRLSCTYRITVALSDQFPRTQIEWKRKIKKRKFCLFFFVLKLSAEVWVSAILSTELYFILQRSTKKCLKNVTIIIQRFYVIYKAFKMFPKCLKGVFLVQKKSKSCLLALGSDMESV